MRRRLQAIVRRRVARAIAMSYGLDPDDVVGMAGEPDEIIQLVMDSIFGKWPPEEEEPYSYYDETLSFGEARSDET